MKDERDAIQLSFPLPCSSLRSSPAFFGCGAALRAANRRQVKRRKEELKEEERQTKQCSCEMIEISSLVISRQEH
jgi:hypothetical protein